MNDVLPKASLSFYLRLRIMMIKKISRKSEPLRLAQQNGPYVSEGAVGESVPVKGEPNFR